MEQYNAVSSNNYLKTYSFFVNVLLVTRDLRGAEKVEETLTGFSLSNRFCIL